MGRSLLPSSHSNYLEWKYLGPIQTHLGCITDTTHILLIEFYEIADLNLEAIVIDLIITRGNYD